MVELNLPTGVQFWTATSTANRLTDRRAYLRERIHVLGDTALTVSCVTVGGAFLLSSSVSEVMSGESSKRQGLRNSTADVVVEFKTVRGTLSVLFTDLSRC